MRFADAMTAVAVGWQVYAVHRNPLVVGLVGLAEFLPLPLLALPAGQLSARFPRRTVGAVAIALNALIVALLLVVTHRGAHALWPFLALASMSGVAAVTGSPAMSALTPDIVPHELLPGAVALRSVAGQIAIVVGPAIGGLLFAISAEVVYAVAVGLFCIAFAGVLGLEQRAAVGVDRAPGFGELVAGVRFVLRTRILLGAIESGVFASLVGTVTAVVAGGIATIGIALSWTRLFPSLARLGRLEDLRPEPV